METIFLNDQKAISEWLGAPEVQVTKEMEKLGNCTPKEKTLCILPTYTAMLELRKALLGKAIC